MGLERSFHDVKHGPPNDTCVNRIEWTDARLDERHCYHALVPRYRGQLSLLDIFVLQPTERYQSLCEGYCLE